MKIKRAILQYKGYNHILRLDTECRYTQSAYRAIGKHLQSQCVHCGNIIRGTWNLQLFLHCDLLPDLKDGASSSFTKRTFLHRRRRRLRCDRKLRRNENIPSFLRKTKSFCGLRGSALNGLLP